MIVALCVVEESQGHRGGRHREIDKLFITALLITSTDLTHHLENALENASENAYILL